MSGQARASDVVNPIVEQARAALAGHPAHIQGAVLADLLATWLGGHIIHDSPAETDALRDRLLALHVGVVRQLVPINAAVIHGRPS